MDTLVIFVLVSSALGCAVLAYLHPRIFLVILLIVLADHALDARHDPPAKVREPVAIKATCGHPCDPPLFH